MKAGDSLDVAIDVRNTGDVDADEVVQLYLSAEDADFEVPLATLVEFRRISLAAGESERVRFTIEPEQMHVFNAAGEREFVGRVHVARWRCLAR